ncbi:hypothetical protein Plhal304r1_c027g0091381 [Plasmopara halstedii]
MVSGARVITCESTGNVSIGGTTTTYKLDVGGTLNCTNLYRSGTIADITLVSGITTIGTGQASKAQKLDASRNAINIASLACDTIIANSATNILNINPTTLQLKGVALTATATQLNVLNGFTGTTANLNILSGTSVSATELNYLDVVIGTGTAFKALVLDSTRNIANVNNISCYSIDLSLHWDISIHTIIDLMDYQSIYLPVLGATAGTASPSKALVIAAITSVGSLTELGIHSTPTHEYFSITGSGIDYIDGSFTRMMTLTGFNATSSNATWIGNYTNNELRFGTNNSFTMISTTTNRLGVDNGITESALGPITYACAGIFSGYLAATALAMTSDRRLKINIQLCPIDRVI